MKILFLVPYPLHEAPSQRFRFEQYFMLLSKQGYTYRVQSFLDSKNWRFFFNTGNTLAKIVALLKGFLKRFFILFQVSSFDFIFIHREVTPIGPPVFEWLIAKIFRKKVIYDFDDAIWLTDRIEESELLRRLKCRNKVKLICHWSYKVSCGNEYLISFAKQFNNHTIYNPTTIDTNNLHNLEFNKKKDEKLTIGWTGSHSTLKYLVCLEPVIQHIERNFQHVQFVVIANKPAVLNLKSLLFIPWKIQTEISDLNQIDIGVMPLPDDEWSKGKCGFKALQFMSLQIPVVASPIGVNGKIVDHGIDGFLASSQDEWIQFLTQLIEDNQLRIIMGMRGREKVLRKYSVTSNANNFMSLFN